MMPEATSKNGPAFRRKVGLLARIVLSALAMALMAPVAAQAFESPRSAAVLMDAVMWNREPIGGPFTLTDHTGKIRTLEDFKGKVLLIYFGFTYCPDVCPTDLQEITLAMDRLGAAAEQVQPIYITLDPERDTTAHLAQYVSLFHKQLIALTGPVKDTSAAADAYRVFYKKVRTGNEADDYTIDHSAFIYLVDREGRYLGFFPPGTDAEKLVGTIKPLVGTAEQR